LTIGPESSFQRGFSATGEPYFRVTDWPGGSQLRQEPACGAVFQPYGPIELSHIASLVAEMALDAAVGALASPTQGIWAAPERQLIRNGGRWTPAWLKLNGGRGDGGCMIEIDWRHVENGEAITSEAAE
jgi:hypothetical protein